MLKEYKEQISYFIKSKKYFIPVIIVTILSFGYAITHESIGIDDLCLDRYAGGTYWLSVKRFGMWIIYNILNIKEFTPFWLDFIVAMFMPLISIILCAFVRKNFSKIPKSIWTYTIFSCVLISNPLINHFYIYQASNLSVVVCNLMVILLEIFMYEQYFKSKNKHMLKTMLLVEIGLFFTLSTYESCAQTYLVFVFFIIFLKTFEEKNKKDNKQLLKFFMLNIVNLLVGIILYNVINSFIYLILESNGILETNQASNGIVFFTSNFNKANSRARLNVVNKFFNNLFKDFKSYLPITIFGVSSIIVLLIEIVNLFKNRKFLRFMSLLCMILTNFIILILILQIFYRIEFSIIITTAFLCAYIYNVFISKRIMKYVVSILGILLIISQSKTLNQYFYNDYKRSEKEKTIINNIAISIVNEFDFKEKPIVFYASYKNGSLVQKYGRINVDNSISIILWGLNAFQESQTELIKYINYFGYSFIQPTKEQVYEAKNEYNALNSVKKDKIVEFDNYIVVNLDRYDLFK